VHIWSDGCGAQFKNKDQYHWLTTGATFGTPLRMVHHFFQSCHGKGPSDSEGAAIQCALRRHELLGDYFADTDKAYAWLCKHLVKVASEYPEFGKPRHSIRSRSFHLVPQGAVDHFGGAEVKDLKTRTMSKFCFDSAGGTGTLTMSLLSGDFCGDCFAGRIEKCGSRGEIFKESPALMDVGTAATKSRAASQHLSRRSVALLKNTGAGGHCFVVFGSGVEGLSPVQLVDGTERQGKVSIYCAYDAVEDDPLTYTLNETAVCPRQISHCGVRGVPPCFKRHIQTVPSKSLRPPTFTMTELPPPFPANAAPTERERHVYAVPEAALDEARVAVQTDEAAYSPSLLY